jgi:hypothetical protein
MPPPMMRTSTAGEALIAASNSERRGSVDKVKTSLERNVSGASVSKQFAKTPSLFLRSNVQNERAHRGLGAGKEFQFVF